MATYRLVAEDIEALLEGLAILGTGGGGSPQWGKAILEQDLAAGRTITIIDPEDIADDALIVCGGIMGSVKTLEKMSIEELLERWETRFELLEATKTMAKYLGREINYVVPFEVGGLNTPVILSLAARMGISALNADALGRSAPETQMTSFIGHGVSLTPMPLVDSAGNTIIVTDQASTVFADEIGRWMVTRGGGMGANNHYPMTGRQAKAAVIPHTITQAIEIGKAVLAARRSGADPVAAAAAELKGWEMFRGVVSKVQGEDKGGFYITSVIMTGQEDSSGQEAKLIIKNETMALWLNGELKAVFPDLVCMLDQKSGSGIMSVDIVPGKEMVLVGTPCHPRLRACLQTDAGALAFSSARYGHPEIEYVPLEKLHGC